MPKFAAGTVKIWRAGTKESFPSVYDAKTDQKIIVGEEDKEFEIEIWLNPIEPELSLQVFSLFPFVFCAAIDYPVSACCMSMASVSTETFGCQARRTRTRFARFLQFTDIHVFVLLVSAEVLGFPQRRLLNHTPICVCEAAA